MEYVYLIVVIVCCVVILILTYRNMNEEIKKLEKESNQLRSRIAFLEEKKKIKEEVFGNAEKVNEKINSSNNNERFDAACSVLCKQKKQ